MDEHTLENNKKKWQAENVEIFTKKGEDWSSFYGDSESQWHHVILPRIKRYIPATSILEIACGWGRWSRFLLNECSQFFCCDVSEKSIKDCSERFYFDILNKKAFVFLNDGLSFKEIKDNSIDFIFSYDSLVHCNSNVIESYVKESNRVLKSTGRVFIHHSNLLDCNLKKDYDNYHWRSLDVGASYVCRVAKNINLNVLSQEVFGFNNDGVLHDCISVLGKTTEINKKYFANVNYHEEIFKTKQISELYV